MERLSAGLLIVCLSSSTLRPRNTRTSALEPSIRLCILAVRVRTHCCVYEHVCIVVCPASWTEPTHGTLDGRFIFTYKAKKENKAMALNAIQLFLN